MLGDVRPLHVRVQRVYGVVEGFWLVVELPAEAAHPLDLLLAGPNVDGVGVVQLAKALAFDESIQDAVHLNFCLETLTLGPKTGDNGFLGVQHAFSVAHL